MLGDSTEIEQVQGQRSSRALCQSAVGALCLCAGQLMITLDSGAVKAMPICYWCPLLLQSPELAKYMLLESTGKQHRSMPSGKHLFQRTVWLLPSSSCAPFNKMWTVPREIFVARTSVNPAGHLPSPHWCVVHRVLRLGFACCCRGLALDSGKWTLEQQRPFQCVIGPSFVASESRVGRVG